MPTVLSIVHGGISRLETFARIARAQGRASSKVCSDIGAMDPHGSARRYLTVLAALTLATAVCAAALAQRRPEQGSYRAIHNIPYDGRFTFVRVRYTPAPGSYWSWYGPSWAHGFPIAEHN